MSEPFKHTKQKLRSSVDLLGLGLSHLTGSIELIDGRWISDPSTIAGVKGILNIMKTFDMIDGDIEPQEGFPIIPEVILITERHRF